MLAGHCYSHNYGSTGIAVLGDFTKRKINTSNATDQALLNALDDLVVYECGRAGLAATDSSEFLRSDGAWHETMPTITGHKDDEATACPGTSLYSYVTNTLRAKVASRTRPCTGLLSRSNASPDARLPSTPQLRSPGLVRRRVRLASNTDWKAGGASRLQPTTWCT